MANKFHVTTRGDVGRCRAEKGFCPFGDEDRHFSSADEARTAYEKAQGIPLSPSLRRESEEHIEAATNWDYADAPRDVQGAPSVAFLRDISDNTLRLRGPERQVRTYLRALDEADTERLSHLKSIRTLSPNAPKKRPSKFQEHFHQVWAEEGFVSYRTLPEHERNMADPGLDYVNGAAYWDPEAPSKTRVYPYSRLYTYSPHMVGNRGHWVNTALQFDYATGNFYGVTRVSGYSSTLLGKEASAYKVTDFGPDLDAAIEGCQKQSDEALQSYLARNPKAQLTDRPEKYSHFDDPLQDHSPQNDAFTTHRALIRKELSKSIKEARRWNELKRDAEQLTSEDQERLTQAGY